MAQNPRLDELRKRLAREPDSPLFAQYAEELRRAGELPEAIRVCREGLAKRPGYATVRVTLGRALAESGDLQAARQEFETVLRSVPDNVSARRGLEELGAATSGGAEAAKEPTSAAAPEVPASGGASEGAAEHTAETPTEKADDAVTVATPPAEAAAAEEPAAPGGGAMAPEDDEDYELEALRPAAPAGPPQLTFRPLVDEDTRRGGGVVDDARTIAAAAVAVPEPAPAARPVSAGAGKASGDELASPTLAELYLQQGSVDKAAEMYAQLLSRDPGNTQLRERAEAARARLAEESASGAGDGGRGAAIRRAIARLEGLSDAFRRGRGDSGRASGATA